MHSYKLIRRLGRGGMGTVYEARGNLPPGESGLPVAIKIMRADVKDRTRYAELFHREARINLDISHNHPGLVTVFAHFQDQSDRQYMVMELIRGCNLHALRKQRGQLPMPVITYVAEHMLESLAYIHERGYLHRDVSPCNVLLSTDGDIKISDLGLATPILDDRAGVGHLLGKFAYASPEAISRGHVDQRADLYSLAAVLYELATGEPPMGHGAKFEHALDLLDDWRPPPMDQLPDALRILIGDLFHKLPDDRHPATARDALDRLRAMGLATATRETIADMIRPIYQDAQYATDDSKRQPALPMSVVSCPIIVHSQAPDPLGDTEPDDVRKSAAATDSHDDESSRTSSGISMSAPGWEPPEPAEAPTDESGRLDGQEPRPRRRHRGFLALVAALMLGFAAHSALERLEAGRTHSAQPSTEDPTIGSDSSPDPPDSDARFPIAREPRPFPEIDSESRAAIPEHDPGPDIPDGDLDQRTQRRRPVKKPMAAASPSTSEPPDSPDPDGADEGFMAPVKRQHL